MKIIRGFSFRKTFGDEFYDYQPLGYANRLLNTLKTMRMTEVSSLD